MAKILLFGSYDVCGVPGEVMTWLQEYIRQGHEFIVGDGKGADSAFHKALSSLGADHVTVYAMDNARNNVYEYPVKKFKTSYDEDTKQAAIFEDGSEKAEEIIENVQKAQDIPITRQWYEFRDKKLINDCDIAIGLWNGSSKTALHIIQLMNIYNKPVYTFTV